jgi:histidine triad (HIT) family protein
MSCLFCNIIEKKIPADIIYEDEDVIAFRDIAPRAPLHLLIIPKLHISTLNDLEEHHANIAGKLLLVAQKLAKEFGHADEGYRVVMNCNQNAGQTVFHIHLHLLGGRLFQWPPG